MNPYLILVLILFGLIDDEKNVVNRLKSENEALMRTLDELEQEIAKGGGTAMEVFNEHDVPEEERRFVPKQTVDKLMKEKSELEDVIKQKEKRMLRLQQVCSLS